MRYRHHEILLLLLQFELAPHRTKYKYGRDDNKRQEKKPLTQVFDAICFFIRDDSIVYGLVKNGGSGAVNGSIKLL